MQHKMYCVYDSKAEFYLPPFLFKSKGEALRAWETTVNDPETQFCKFPADFTLFEIGEYDDLTGSVNLHVTKVNLGLAVEFKRKPQVEAPLLESIKPV